MNAVGEVRRCKGRTRSSAASVGRRRIGRRGLGGFAVGVGVSCFGARLLVWLCTRYSARTSRRFGVLGRRSVFGLAARRRAWCTAAWRVGRRGRVSGQGRCAGAVGRCSRVASGRGSAGRVAGSRAGSSAGRWLKLLTARR
jgi:hypothetical protein